MISKIGNFLFTGIPWILGFYPSEDIFNENITLLPLQR